MEIDFVYSESIPCVWKAPVKGKIGFYTPEPYCTYRDDLSQFLTIKYRNSEWVKSLSASDRFALTCVVYRKYKRGDLTNFVKGVEDCMQIAGLIPNDSQIVLHNNYMATDPDGPGVHVRLIKIFIMKGKSNMENFDEMMRNVYLKPKPDYWFQCDDCGNPLESREKFCHCGGRQVKRSWNTQNF